MAGTSNQFLSGVTPAKLGLIAVLCIVLLIVLWVQYSGSDSEPIVKRQRRADSKDGVEAVSPRPVSTSGPAARSPLSDRRDLPRTRQWQEVTRDEIARLHDPFQRPTAFESQPDPEITAEPETPGTSEVEMVSQHERRMTWIESLRGRGVDMVLMTPRGKLARIGELDVREGDVLEGMRVVQIHTRGIVLEPERPRLRAGLPREMSAPVFNWLLERLVEFAEENNRANNQQPAR